MKFPCVMEEGGYISDKYGVKWAFKALIKMSATSARGFHLSFLTCLRLYAALQESRFLCCRRFSRFLHLSRLLHPGVPQGWCFLPLRKFITWLQPSSMLASHSGLQRLISALECFALSWGRSPDAKACATSTAAPKCTQHLASGKHIQTGYRTAFVFVWLQVYGLMKFFYKSQTTGVFVHVRLQQAESGRRLEFHSLKPIWVSCFSQA